MTEKLLSISKAAAYLNISKATINRWQAKGALRPVYTPGGHRRYPADEVWALLRRSESAD